MDYTQFLFQCCSPQTPRPNRNLTVGVIFKITLAQTIGRKYLHRKLTFVDYAPALDDSPQIMVYVITNIVSCTRLNHALVRLRLKNFTCKFHVYKKMKEAHTNAQDLKAAKLHACFVTIRTVSVHECSRFASSSLPQ